MTCVGSDTVASVQIYDRIKFRWVKNTDGKHAQQMLMPQDSGHLTVGSYEFESHVISEMSFRASCHFAYFEI